MLIEKLEMSQNAFTSIKHLHIQSTVEPPLTDTSCRQTPLVSGLLAMFLAAYKHYIFNLPKANTDTFSGPEGVCLQEVRLYNKNHMCGKCHLETDLAEHNTCFLLSS